MYRLAGRTCPLGCEARFHGGPFWDVVFWVVGGLHQVLAAVWSEHFGHYGVLFVVFSIYGTLDLCRNPHHLQLVASLSRKSSVEVVGDHLRMVEVRHSGWYSSE